MAIGTPLAAVTLPGTVELAALTAGALLPRRTPAPAGAAARKTAVVIPAHNEEAAIGRAVSSLASSEGVAGELTTVVIADNCSDQTAAIAQAAGARVMIRTHHQLRGKGFALDFAFRQLLREGFGYLIVVDADSVVDRGFVRRMQSMLAGADAVQCAYKVANASDSIRTRLMNVALLAFNVLRPRGRDRLGLSAGILGNGFALRSATLRDVPYDAGSVVEDLEYHLRLVRAGKRVRFADTTVWGDMPASGKGVSTQRARWEGGRFLMLRQHGAKLAKEVFRGRLTLLEPLLDLLLFPLAMHVSLLLVLAAIPCSFTQVYAGVALSIVVLHILAAIATCGGDWRDLASLAVAPFYVAWKLTVMPLVVRASRSDATWVRTARKQSSGESL